MSTRRNKSVPAPKMAFWKTDGRFYFADPSDLQAAIEASGLPPEEVSRRLGAGRRYLQELFQGGKISPYSVQLIEWSLSVTKEPNSIR